MTGHAALFASDEFASALREGISIRTLAPYFGRRTFLKKGVAWTALAGGFIPTAEALAQTPGTFNVRSPIARPVEIWLYTIHMPAEFPSEWTFGSKGAAAIPRGFFGTGSDPWVGNVACVGIPLDTNGPAPTADLVVRSDTVNWATNPTSTFGPQEVPSNLKVRCEMYRLQERGTQPLTVTYDNGSRQETWDVLVTIAKDHPGGGYIDMTWISPNGNGGLCDIEIAVKVDFTFTQRTPSGPGRVLTLASGIEWLAETNHSFVRRPGPTVSSDYFISPGTDGGFVPGLMDLQDHILSNAACSKNETVAHSFTLPPRSPPALWGTNNKIKQFAPRKE